jgi:hypothetical protein
MISLSNPTMIYDPITDDLYSDEIDVIPDQEGYFDDQENFYNDDDVFTQGVGDDDDMYEPDFQYYD